MRWASIVKRLGPTTRALARYVKLIITNKFLYRSAAIKLLRHVEGMHWIPSQVSVGCRPQSLAHVLGPCREAHWLTMHHVRLEPQGVLSLPEASVYATVPQEVDLNDPLARSIAVFSNGLPVPFSCSIKPSQWAQRRPSSDNKLILEGVTIIAGGYHKDCNNYFHYWADVMTDLWFLSHHGVSWQDVDHILLPYAGLAWQSQILKLCQIPIEKIRPLSQCQLFSVGQLMLAWREKGARTIPDYLTVAMREMCKYRPKVYEKVTGKIYITRKGAKRRPMLNESEVIEFVQSQGFLVIDLAMHSVKEQLNLIASAEVIVAPHGAGLTNLAWAHPEAKIIELMSCGYPVFCFRKMATQLDLSYQIIPSSWHAPFALREHAAWAVNIEALKKAIGR